MSASETTTIATVRARALEGAVLVTGRGFLVKLFGLAGNIVLARLLTPKDFGVVALGGTVVTFASLFSEGGLAAGFVRGRKEPAREDLEVAVWFQFYGSLVVVLAVSIPLVLLLGETGLAAAIMLASLPIIAFRTPGAISFERGLEYRPLVMVELGEVVAYNAVAIGAVALGAGVWGLVGGLVFRALAGTILMVAIGHPGLVAPRFHRGRLRGMLSFGARFQGITVANLARDQGLNIGIAAVAGLGVLGLWSLAGRVLSVPLLVMSSLRRVSYPGMARISATGAEMRPYVDRSMALAGVGAAVIVTFIVGTSPAFVIAVFGERWADVQDLLPLAGAAIMINGPTSVSAFGFLLAEGHVSPLFYSAVAQAVVGVGVTLALLPALGLVAVGVGMILMSTIDAVVGVECCRRRSGIWIGASVVRFFAMCVPGAALSWLVADAMAPTLLTVLVSAVVGEAVLLAVLTLFARAHVLDAARLFAKSGRLAVRGAQPVGP